MNIQETINKLLELGKWGLTRKVYIETDTKRFEVTEDMVVEAGGDVYILIEDLLKAPSLPQELSSSGENEKY